MQNVINKMKLSAKRMKYKMNRAKTFIKETAIGVQYMEIQGDIIENEEELKEIKYNFELVVKLRICLVRQSKIWILVNKAACHRLNSCLMMLKTG